MLQQVALVLTDSFRIEAFSLKQLSVEESDFCSGPYGPIFKSTEFNTLFIDNIMH